jgi:hypothetical protein
MVLTVPERKVVAIRAISIISLILRREENFKLVIIIKVTTELIHFPALSNETNRHNRKLLCWHFAKRSMVSEV